MTETRKATPPVEALICHPDVGSLWLYDAYIDGDYVVGQAYAETCLGHDIYETMHFPKTCIRKWRLERT